MAQKLDVSLLYMYVCFNKPFYLAALKGSGVLLSPERAGGRQGRKAPLTFSPP